MGDSIQDAYVEAKFTAEISNRMQVPSKIVVAGSPGEPFNQGLNESPEANMKFNDLGMRRRDPRLDMQVPDRILVAGGNSHIASKSTPWELQLENSVLPPTPEHVRVSTPPRSIRLSEHTFPTATDDESGSSSTYGPSRKPQSVATSAETSERNGVLDSPLSLMTDRRGDGLRNASLGDEMQLLRRHMAKLNHRLMAVELENQQQQQREMILTVLVSAYFIGKIFFWLNKST